MTQGVWDQLQALLACTLLPPAQKLFYWEDGSGQGGEVNTYSFITNTLWQR